MCVYIYIHKERVEDLDRKVQAKYDEAMRLLQDIHNDVISIIVLVLIITLQLYYY